MFITVLQFKAGMSRIFYEKQFYLEITFEYAFAVGERRYTLHSKVHFITTFLYSHANDITETNENESVFHYNLDSQNSMTMHG